MAGSPFKYYHPSRLTNKTIISIAGDISDLYAQLNGDVHPDLFSIAFDQVFDSVIYPHYEILLDEESDLGFHQDEKVLGFYDAESNAISLDRLFKNNSEIMRWKRTFTGWHELGHAILHRSWLLTQKQKRISTSEQSLSYENEARLERQANLFAAHAAAPQWFLDFVLKSTFDLTRPIRYIGPTTYDLYPRGCQRRCRATNLYDLCMNIAYAIRHRFGELSIEALTYRIQESRWIDNVSGPLPENFVPRPMRKTFVHSSKVMNAWQSRVLRKAVVASDNVYAEAF